VFRADDRAVLSERQLEGTFRRPGLHRNMPFTDEYQKRATVFELQEGVACTYRPPPRIG